MIAASFIAFREGLEAALIIAIVLGYLVRTGRRDRQGAVWAGVGVAVAVSLAAAIALQLLGAELEGTAEQLFEGTAMALAAGILTWMVFWMSREAAGIRTSLEAGVSSATEGSARGGLFMLAFVAVVREGLETALFITAAVFTSNPAEAALGTALGLAAAVAVGAVVLAGSARLNLGLFFKVTGAFLIIFAAGLVASSIGEFHEAGLLPALIAPLWSTKQLLDDHVGVGAILRSLFGYSDEPSLLQVLGYLGYIAIVVAALLRGTNRGEAPVTGTAALQR